MKSRSIDLRAVLDAEARVERLRERRRELEAARSQLQCELAHVATQQSAFEAPLRKAGRRRVEWGDLNRARPISPEWGFDRGNEIATWWKA